MPADRPKRADMTWIKLLEGPGDQLVLPVAPTMKRIIHKGERYFRMDGTWSVDDNGSHGGCYLWDGWFRAMTTVREAEGPGASQ